MHRVGSKNLIWSLFIVFTGLLLSGCQINSIYSSPSSNFIFKYPRHWELIEETRGKVEFRVEDKGSAIIAIEEVEAILASTAKEQGDLILGQPKFCVNKPHPKRLSTAWLAN